MIDPKLHNIEDFQNKLDLNFPSPEEDLIGLSKTVAYSPDEERYSEIRFLVLETDSLLAQLRWHIGQAFSLAIQYPQICEQENKDDMNPEADIPPLSMEMPTKSQLLLRGFISRPERVLYTNLSENRRGGTVAGWMYHMMVDDAVARSIGILDRLARIISLVANVPFTNDKVYFRSKKLALIHKTLDQPETQRLVDIAESDVFDLLLNYRDGWNHERLTYSSIAGFAPVDSYIDSSGQYVRILPFQLTGDYLLALTRAAYDQVIKAIHEVRIVCEQRIPKSKPTV